MTVNDNVEQEPSAPTYTTLEEFFRHVSTHAYRFAELNLRHRDDALDVLQDAMINMLTYTNRPATEWRPLFWSILRNRMIDFQRRAGFRLKWVSDSAHDQQEQLLDWADQTPGPAGMHETQQTYTRLANALQKLPARQREAFILRSLEEFDVAETANIMQCSEGSVKTHLSRAREALRVHMEEFK